MATVWSCASRYTGNLRRYLAATQNGWGNLFKSQSPVHCWVPTTKDGHFLPAYCWRWKRKYSPQRSPPRGRGLKAPPTQWYRFRPICFPVGDGESSICFNFKNVSCWGEQAFQSRLAVQSSDYRSSVRVWKIRAHHDCFVIEDGRLTTELEGVMIWLLGVGGRKRQQKELRQTATDNGTSQSWDYDFSSFF